ncbi:MAG: hypothetical protein HYU87_11900 [Chloroflexi bacterium]|nr:hypothetical protein [Chloroflexota bacterium]
MTPHPVAEITRAYEAVRAQATGDLAASSPRGLALILDQGLASWIAAWSSRMRGEVATTTSVRTTEASDPVSAELASVLAEMALASRRCPA